MAEQPQQSLVTPGLGPYLKSLNTKTIDANIEDLVALLRRRQIRGSRACASATARLLRRVISDTKASDPDKLIQRVNSVGRKLTAAQPREISMGNIVRRVLGVIRMEAGEDRGAQGQSESNADSASESQSRSGMSPMSRSQELSPVLSPEARESLTPLMGSAQHSSAQVPQRPPLLTSHTTFASGPPIASMFSLLSQGTSLDSTPLETPNMPGSQSPAGFTNGIDAAPNSLTSNALASLAPFTDLRAEVVEGIDEIIDELDVVDDQIASYATEHIHSNEIILTYGSSTSVQKFLLRAASKRKFTVVHAEAYPNNHKETHAVVTGIRNTDDGADGATDEDYKSQIFAKPLIAAGITVILIPDSAVFAIMSRVNKVILGTHVVLANGGLVASAGAKIVAMAAKMHKTPVVVLSGVYKLSPMYPFDFDALIEYGDAGHVLDYTDGDLVDKVSVENPLYDYVEPELVDLYITNLGGHAPSYLYRIVADHYHSEDTNLVVVDD